MYAFRKTSDAFRQRSSLWRPLTECTRSFPEGMRNFFFNFRSLPVFPDISRKLSKCIIPQLLFKSHFHHFCLLLCDCGIFGFPQPIQSAPQCRYFMLQLQPNKWQVGFPIKREPKWGQQPHSHIIKGYVIMTFKSHKRNKINMSKWYRS